MLKKRGSKNEKGGNKYNPRNNTRNKNVELSTRNRSEHFSIRFVPTRKKIHKIQKV